MDALIFLMFVLAWVGTGFFTALIRWKWGEGAESITHFVAAREVGAACDELILGGGIPSGFAKSHYEESRKTAKSAFFFASVVMGPVGTVLAMAGWGWETCMRKIRD